MLLFLVMTLAVNLALVLLYISLDLALVLLSVFLSGKLFIMLGCAMWRVLLLVNLMVMDRGIRNVLHVNLHFIHSSTVICIW